MSGLAAALAGAKLRRVQRVSVPGMGDGWGVVSNWLVDRAFPHLRDTEQSTALPNLDCTCAGRFK